MVPAGSLNGIPGNALGQSHQVVPLVLLAEAMAAATVLNADERNGRNNVI